MQRDIKTAVVEGRRRLEVPQSIFGPFKQLEALPWLMFATGLRVFANDPPPVMLLLITVLSAFAVFLAFRITVQRAIELTNCPVRLGYLNFTQQLTLALDIVGRVLLLSFAAVIVMIALQNEHAFYMFIGLEAIAFDQKSRAIMVWSGVLAALMLMMVLNAERSRTTSIRNAVKELAWHGVWMAPAIVAVALFLIGLNLVQGWGRSLVAMYWQTEPTLFAKAFVYFLFVFGFATLRLWVVVAILVGALRLSYRFNIGPAEPDTIERG